MATGKSVEVTTEDVVDDHIHRYMRVHAYPVFGKGGAANAFIEVIEDITGRKQVEEELAKYRENLEESVKERTAELRAANEQLQWEITERKRAEETLRESEEKYRSLVEFTEDPVYLIDKGKRYLYMNGKYLSRLGLPRDQVIGSYYGDFHSSEENEEFSVHIEQVFATGRFVQYDHLSRRDGRYFLRTLSPVKEPDGSIKAVTVISKDITERKQAEEELTYMVTHDPLTGLPNRMLFNDRLTLALAQARRHKMDLAVMLLDLDNFKNVNDGFGHNVGDQLLRAVGNRLTGLLRRGDTVARVGGDEFLVLLPEIIRITDAATVTHNILEAFRKPFTLDDHELQITTSIGVVIYPHDGDDADTLMKHADIAMYRAKDKGRNTYQCYGQQLE
jgi:diguanylate cyclase (GGDEF)-like protein/PAS domain S-box-containing protein